MANTDKELKLKMTVLAKVIEDEDLQLKISKAIKMRLSTIKTWLRQNSINLTLAIVLETIKTHFKMKASEVLTEEVEIKQAA